MKHVKWVLLVFAMICGATTMLAQPPAPAPSEGFKAVHLVSLTPTQESSLLAALTDVNAAVAQAGHPDIRYRLYKVSGKQSGKYTHMWESTWPSGAVYDQVHKSAAFETATKKHPEIEELMKEEMYNRYVEVTAPAR
jgi:hypothetical protein